MASVVSVPSDDTSADRAGRPKLHVMYRNLFRQTRGNPMPDIPGWVWVVGGVGLASLLIAATSSNARTGDVPLRLGDTTVIMNTRRWGSLPLVFLNVHENEVASVAAAESVLATTGGILIRLQHGGERFIDFTLSGRQYTLDPNRIYSDVGASLSVSPSDPAAIRAARDFARSLVSHLPPGPVVALHNNTRGEPLTIYSYAPGGIYAAEAGNIHIEPGASPDDFFLVTTRPLFNALAAKRFNVVLQSASPTDDGSMSVYYAKHGIPYVNIEAEHGAVERQKRMVQAVVEVMA